MNTDIPSDTWFWNARYKFVWDRDTFIDYLEVMVEVIQKLIKEYSSTPKIANTLVSQEIGILHIPDPEDTERAKGFAIYIADIRVKELNTTLFSWFKTSYRLHIGADEFSGFMFSEGFIREKHGEHAELIINKIKKRKQLNKHFRTLANKSLNHRRKISTRLRYQILLRDDSTCQMCGRSAPSVKVHIDHKVPVSWDKDWKFSSNINDYQVLCEECNLGKSNMSWLWSV